MSFDPRREHLATVLPVEKRRKLLKRVRTQLIESARPALELLIRDTTGDTVRSLYHDINTCIGDEVVIITLAETPHFREAKKR